MRLPNIIFEAITYYVSMIIIIMYRTNFKGIFEFELFFKIIYTFFNAN